MRNFSISRRADLSPSERRQYFGAFANLSHHQRSVAHEFYDNDRLPPCHDAPACSLLPWWTNPCRREQWVRQACLKSCGKCYASYPSRTDVAPLQNPAAISSPSWCQCAWQRVCILVASSISSRDPWLMGHINQVAALTQASPACAVLNLFDVRPLMSLATASQCKEAGIAITRVPGFKPAFWKAVLTVNFTLGVTHVFTIDADLDVHPRVFDLPQLERIGRSTLAHIISPAPWGAEPGFHAADAPRKSHSAHPLARCEPLPMLAAGSTRWPVSHSLERCVACRVAVVEIKMPLFTVMAWRVVHAALLAPLSADQLQCDDGLDSLWCELVEAHLTRCNCRWCKHANRTYFNAAGCGTACTVSYETPVRHLNHETLRTRMREQANGGRRLRSQPTAPPRANSHRHRTHPTLHPLSPPRTASAANRTVTSMVTSQRPHVPASSTRRSSSSAVATGSCPYPLTRRYITYRQMPNWPAGPPNVTSTRPGRCWRAVDLHMS